MCVCVCVCVCVRERGGGGGGGGGGGVGGAGGGGGRRAGRDLGRANASRLAYPTTSTRRPLNHCRIIVGRYDIICDVTRNPLQIAELDAYLSLRAEHVHQQTESAGPWVHAPLRSSTLATRPMSTGGYLRPLRVCALRVKRLFVGWLLNVPATG